MHVHILNKVWGDKQGVLDTHTVTHSSTQVSMKLCIGVGLDVASQVDINTEFPIKLCIGAGPDEDCNVYINSCTDPCTHSKQSVGTEMR